MGDNQRLQLSVRRAHDCTGLARDAKEIPPEPPTAFLREQPAKEPI